MGDWNSEQYLKFKKDRTQPSIDLANRIDLKSPQRIIDIGCGPGNSTAILKNKYPDAYVLGVDFSPNMIEKAKSQHSDIDFMIFDATKDFEKLDEKFDIVFSNACIQWVPDHQKLLRDMMSILNSDGIMAVQVPINEEQIVHKIIKKIADYKKWGSKFTSTREFYTLTEYEYFDLLADISNDFNLWKTVYCHRMPSHDSIIEWYKGTALRPYLDALNDTEKEEFENDILAELKKEYPIQSNGEIIFHFPRLFFTAIK